MTDGPVRSADELVPDLSGDLTRLASQIGEPYDYLRTLLATLPSPFLPTLREARSSPANPVADASQFGTGLGLAGGPIGQSSGTEIGSGIANLDIYNVPALAGGGFPVAWRRFLTGGVYNGDFGIPTLVSANNVENITNPMPYWAFVQSVGTTVTCKWGADSNQASGGRLELTMTSSGTAADEGYIEQVIPVNGSRAQSFSYTAALTQLGQATVGARPSLFLEAQYLKNDKVTTTGTVARTTTSTGAGISTILDIFAQPNGGQIPTDAYYLRIRVGLVATAIGQAVTNSVGEVRVYAAPDRLYMAPGAAVAPAYWTFDANSDIILRAGGADRFSSDIPYRFTNAPAEFSCSGSLVATTTPTDIPGCTTTFTRSAAKPETVLVWGIFDVDISVASTAAAVGSLVVDGVTQTASAIFRQNTAAGRATVTQMWIVSLNELVSASHTFKLQGSKSAALGTIQFNVDHTKMVIERQG